MSKEEKIHCLCVAAKNYVSADKNLEAACQGKLDPIACTVFAMKNRHTDSLPQESFSAASCLNEVLKIHSELMKEFGMTADEVRNIWYPILNGEIP
jgi:hypothetical protein